MAELNTSIKKLLEFNSDYELLFKITEVFLSNDKDEIKSVFIDVQSKYTPELLLNYAKNLKETKDRYDPTMGGPFNEVIKKIIKKHIRIEALDNILDSLTSDNGKRPLKHDEKSDSNEQISKKQRVDDKKTAIAAVSENQSIIIQDENLAKLFINIASCKKYTLFEPSNVKYNLSTGKLYTYGLTISEFIEANKTHACNSINCYYLLRHKHTHEKCCINMLKNVFNKNICNDTRCNQMEKLTSDDYKLTRDLLDKPIHIKDFDKNKICIHQSNKKKSLAQYYYDIEKYLTLLLEKTHPNINFKDLSPIKDYKFIYYNGMLIGYI